MDAIDGTDEDEAADDDDEPVEADDPLLELDPSELAQLRRLAAAPARYRPEDIALAEGTRVAGHLRIVRKLGAGTMGAVFLAFDETLERQVALKVHLDTEPRSVARLEREARALARVNHPNVLAVHEVGTVGKRLFVATEYVQGQDLRAWLGQSRRWAEVVEVFTAAAQGLAAAHQAGLVHRDFKPANVLIGDDGRVRVADFGLARSLAAAADDEPSPGEGSGSSFDDPQLTRTQAVVGTPAYMAPEQFRGEASPRADQFSFCVALAEALWGRRPYGDVLAGVATPDDLALPVDGTVPPWLRTLVVRGVAVDPRDRFESMEEVVHALQAGVRRRAGATTWGAVIVAGGSLLALGAVLLAPDEASRCVTADDGMPSVWNERVDGLLRSAFEEARPPVGAQTWAVLSGRLDDYVRAWQRERAGSCAATHRDGVQSERLLEQSMACFDRRRAELSGVLRALQRVRAEGVAHAWRTIPETSDLDACRDAARLMAWAEAPPGSAQAWADIRYAESLSAIGYEAESLTLLERAIEQATAVQDELAAVEAALALAASQAMTGDADAAIATAEQAYFSAKALDDPEHEAMAAVDLAAWQSSFHHDYGGARVWLKLARSRAADVALLDAEVTRAEAMMLEAEGKYDASIEILGAALAKLPEGPSAERMELLDMLSTSYDQAGRWSESLAAVEQALVIAEQLAGEAGTHVPYMLGNQGLVLGRLGRHEEALAVMRRGVELQELISGREYVDSMGPRLNLAVAYLHAGQAERALEMLPTVYEATRARWGPDHPDLALVLEARGSGLRALGRHEDALADFGEATRIARQTSGPDHPTVATYLGQTALTRAEMGDHAGARDAYLSTAMTWERAGQPSHPAAREARVGVAKACAELQAWDDAQAHAQKALLAGQDAPDTDLYNVQASFVLARAFFESHEAPEQGLDLARRTLEAARAGGHAELAAAVAAWLQAGAEG